MQIKESMSFRVFVIGFLILFMAGWSQFILSLVKERQSRMQEVQQEMSNNWGSSQILSYFQTEIETKNGTGSISSAVKIENFSLSADTHVELKNRTLFFVPVYSSKIHIEGTLRPQKVLETKDIQAGSSLLLSMNISDIHGIQSSLLKINESEVPLDRNKISVQKEDEYYGQNQNTHLVWEYSIQNPLPETTKFSLDIEIHGTKKLAFSHLPVASHVQLASNWTSPSYYGKILPEEKSENGDTILANWNTPALFEEEEFGVEFMLPVDIYQKIERAVKYAILFISTTFFAFFITEVLSKQKIHPIQYLLVGFSMLIFYVLLLSFSEHFQFYISYIISAFATISLISFYCFSILRGKNAALSIAILLSLIYIFLYILLSMEDNSLLVGSIFSFCIIASVMILTRKIDWYNLSGEEKK